MNAIEAGTNRTLSTVDAPKPRGNESLEEVVGLESHIPTPELLAANNLIDRLRRPENLFVARGMGHEGLTVFGQELDFTGNQAVWAGGPQCTLAHAVALVDEVEMRVELHDVDRLLTLEGGDAGNVDRVVATDDDPTNEGGER